jgi:hypothetical protein
MRKSELRARVIDAVIRRSCPSCTVTRDGKYRYVCRIPPEKVPQRRRVAVQAAEKVARKVLGLTRAAYDRHWMAEVDRNMAQRIVAEGIEDRMKLQTVRSNWLYGMYTHRKGNLWVRVDQDVEELVRTTLHECRHAWQHLTGFDGDPEADARAFAERYTGPLWARMKDTAGFCTHN